VVNNLSPIYGSADFTGRVSKLSGHDFSTAVDVIDGLPRSAENHMTFAAVFARDRNLYFSQGGNTNHGAPAAGIFNNRAESALSAAILTADVRSPGFQGLSSVEVFAPGTRNAYGLTSHGNGLLYVLDQGGDVGFGGRPDPDGSGAIINVPASQQDELSVLRAGHYYGHPNPARNQLAFQADLPDGTPHQAPMLKFPLTAIATGLAAYDSAANNGALLDRLIVTTFGDDDLHYVQLAADGLRLAGNGVITGDFANPLAVTVGADGTIYVLEAGASLGYGGAGPARITILEPAVPALGAWSAKAQMPIARSEHAAVAIGSKIYVIGGDASDGKPSSSMVIYDTAADIWKMGRPYPGVPVNHPAAAVVDDRLYVFGGLEQWPEPALAAVWMYDPVADVWSQRTPMPRARGAMASAVFGGKVYLFGGLADGEAVSDVTIYDPGNDQWEDLSISLPMPTPRDHVPAAVSPGGLIYVVGGRMKDIDHVTGVVEAFDPIERRWLTGYAPLPTPRGGNVAATLHGRIIVSGGEGAHGSTGTFNQVEEYDPVTNTWRTLQPMPGGRHGTAAVVVNNVMYVPGGGAVAGDHQTTDMQAFSLAP
jgi:N-acetylneuraminic acid mutarotase